MAKQAGITYQQIINQMKSGDWKPIYFLMGEEDYYIDKIANYIEDNLLTEDEKEFNMTIIYGKKETVFFNAMFLFVWLYSSEYRI